MKWHDVYDAVTLILAVVGIILTYVLAQPYVNGGQSYSFGGELISLVGSSNSQFNQPGSNGAAITQTVTATVTTTNTVAITNLQSSVTSLQSVTSILQSTSSVLQNQLAAANQQAASLQLVTVSGQVNLNGSGFNSASSITFTGRGETYSVDVQNSVYSIEVPRGTVYQVTVHGSGWFWLPWEKSASPSSVDLTSFGGSSSKQTFTVSV